MQDNSPCKIKVCGIDVYPFLSDRQLLNHISSHPGILVATNAEKMINASPRLRDIINNNIGYPDGAGVVKALRRKGVKNINRIPGCELWLKIIAENPDASFYLIGSTDEVITETVQRLRRQYPAINIVGYHNGFLKSDDERRALIADVTDKKPRFVFVAMGSPRQEYLMEELMEAHSATYQGLGGSFDLFVGNFKRAPKWLQRANCEWVWRFIAQPSRIARISPYLKFAWRLYSNKL